VPHALHGQQPCSAHTGFQTFAVAKSIAHKPGMSRRTKCGLRRGILMTSPMLTAHGWSLWYRIAASGLSRLVAAGAGKAMIRGMGTALIPARLAEHHACQGKPQPRIRVELIVQAVEAATITHVARPRLKSVVRRCGVARTVGIG